jgi:hypothetical protein
VKRRGWYSLQVETQLTMAAEDARVDANDVKEWWVNHPAWTLEQCVARYVNLRDQATRRAGHDTGYEPRDWQGYMSKKGAA